MIFEDHGKKFAHHNVLHSIAQQRQIAAYLEVGVCYGDSLKVILDVQFPGKLVLCDSWGGESGGEQFGGPTHIEKLLKEMNYWYPVAFLNGNSHELLKTVTEQFDLILVDGDHTADGARQDLEDCWPLLIRHYGLLVFDDLSHPAHPELLDVFREFADSVGAKVLHEDLLTPMGVGVLCKT